MGSTGRLVGSPWIWKDGEFVRWEDAQVHVLSLAVQFAASVFEGVRCYETAEGAGGLPAGRAPEAADVVEPDVPDAAGPHDRGAGRRGVRDDPPGTT